MIILDEKGACMGKKISESDYESWCRVDEWNFKDAALLLHGFDPLNYRSVKFNLRETPKAPELKETYLTFLVLKNFNGGKHRYMTGANPLEIFYIAKEKNLPVPEKLNTCLEELFKLKKEKQQLSSPKTFPIKEAIAQENNKDFSVRERHTLLKAIGLFITLLADDPKHAKKIIIKGRINASQVMQILSEKAYSLDINPQGIKSFDRKINEAMELLEEEKL